MAISKLQYTKKEREAAAKLSKKLSSYLGEKVEIGSDDAVQITYSGVNTKEALREWFALGREKMKLATLHDKNAQEE